MSSPTAFVYTCEMTVKAKESITLTDVPYGTYAVEEDTERAQVKYFELTATASENVKVEKSEKAPATPKKNRSEETL